MQVFSIEILKFIFFFPTQGLRMNSLNNFLQLYRPYSAAP